MQRFGQIIELAPGAIERYDALHAAVWPGVLATIHACNIRNYSIFRSGTTLFAYFEYVGVDVVADMARMAADPVTQEWWRQTDPLQLPRQPRTSGNPWTQTIEVFHTD